MKTQVDEKLFQSPIFFEKNRVRRVYTGGALFADFFGDDSKDGFFPEEWVVSSVAAINKESAGEKEGVSKVLGKDIYFDDLLIEHTHEMVGDRSTFGVLTKVLDSAIRLPVQAHPNKAFSRKYFGSDYGKAESWLVLATRPGAKLYFGFKESMTKQRLAKAVEDSLHDKKAMEVLLNEIDVKPGDVYLVPAKMVHAIGYGCLILEIQEPTDFTIQPEYYCGDYLLNDKEMYINLDHDNALDVFDYAVSGEKAIAMGLREPKTESESRGVRIETLISYDDTPCFSVLRYTIENAEKVLTEAPAVYVVVDGNGSITSNDGTRKLAKGDYFFLPYNAKDKAKIASDGKITVAVCLPPLKK